MQQSVVIVDRNGTEHEFPAGFDPKKAAGIVRSRLGGVQPEAETPKAQAEPSGLQRAAQTFLDYVPNPMGIARGIRKVANAVTSPEAIPTVGAIGGGIVGSVLGPLGAIAGAGIGGGLGKGGEIMAREARGEAVPQDASGVLGAMAARGAGEAALQAGGGLISKGAQMAAKPVYNLGLRASMKLRRAHPDLAKTGIDEGISVSRRGTEKARALRGESRQTADRMIADAEKAGAGPVTTNEVVRGGGFSDIAQGARTRAQGGMTDETAAVADRARTLHLRNRGGVPLTQAQAIKREAQEKAQNVYRAAERGGPPPTINADLDAATASGFQKAIEARVPGVAKQNTRTQSLGGLTQALEDAGDRNHVLSQLLFPIAGGVSAGVGSGLATGDATTGIGGGLTTAALTSGLTSPRALSGAAIGMDRFGKWNLPVNAVRAAMLAAMMDDDKQ